LVVALSFDPYFTFVHVRQRLQLWEMDSHELGRMLDRWGRTVGIEQRWASDPKTFANPSIDCNQTNRRYPWAMLDAACAYVKEHTDYDKRQGDLFDA
jgi:hypothetical protein